MVDRSTVLALVLATAAAGGGAYVIGPVLTLGLGAMVFWVLFLYGTVGASILLFGGGGGGDTAGSVTPDAYVSKGAREQAERAAEDDGGD